MVQFTASIMAPATAALLISCLAPSVYASPISSSLDSCIEKAGVALIEGGATPDDLFKCIAQFQPERRDVGGMPPPSMGLNEIPGETPHESIEPKFIECMKGKSLTDPAEVMNCFNESREKRQTSNNLVARDMIPALFDADCAKGNIPDLFMEAAQFRSKARGFCDKMRKEVLDKGDSAHEEEVTDGTQKRSEGGWTRFKLKRDQKLGFYTRFTLTARGRDLIKGAKDPNVAFDELCNAAIERLGTRGQGCTREIAISKSKAEGRGNSQTTGVLNGVMNIFDEKDKKVSVASVIVDMKIDGRIPPWTEADDDMF
ncbi:uncharacterized protein GIQ15_02549 [Arthroderma uncinatum]|uniref:uncharacterized protein n=1 Tax=Arthroderma uncinatum TaxID=74035 RepID=UPI00144AD273|nr:uncharacterized protein GIQ15_02549 [Arthroderma uncinatum]KAF3483225.1 hypothetical protein GIQ15_02549 [Arthroderma uncinatum]